MKFIIFFLLSSQAFSQIIQTREVRTSPHTFATKKVKVKTNYVSAQDRDKILEKQVPELVNKWDEVDRDIFYKSLLNYDDSRMKEKYPQLTNKNIKDLREQFKIQ